MDFARLFDFITLKQRFAGIAFALCMLFTMQSAQASLILDSFDRTLLGTEILGGSLFVAETGDVTATFLGSNAGYFNMLYLNSPGDDAPIFIFDKNNSGSDSFELGSFIAGTELVFQLDVRPGGPNQSDAAYSLFTGSGIDNLNGFNNPDYLAHARAVTTLGEDYLTTVGFEDLLGGGDRTTTTLCFH